MKPTTGKRRTRQSKPRRRNSRFFRPAFEQLEDRCLLSAGSLDPTFGNGGLVTTDFNPSLAVYDVAVQPNGKVIAAGYMIGGGFGMARYNEDGSLDTSFGSSGLATGPAGESRGVAIQDDGKILLAGWSVDDGNYDFRLARYNSDGSLDASFGSGGYVTTDFGASDLAHDVAVQTDGKIVVCGRTWDDFALARYNGDGSLDNTFGTNGTTTTDFAPFTGYAKSIAIQSDGKILAAGLVHGGGITGFGTARYNADGTADMSFGTDGKVITHFGPGPHETEEVVVRESGEILVVGAVHPSSHYMNFAVAGYAADGNPDSSFGTNGQVVADFGDYTRPHGAALQTDGKLLVFGYGPQGWGQNEREDFALARFHRDGRLDTAFGSDGIVFTNLGGNDNGYAVSFQPDGKIVVVGGTDGQVGLARYSAGEAAIDFGDAPESASISTLLANDGARHYLGEGLFLGEQVDGDWDGQPTTDANGDDTAGLDDEDGVELISSMLALDAGTSTSAFLVTASQPGKLDAWIDFDGNGGLDHPGEHIGGGSSIDLDQGNNIVSFTIPAGSATGNTVTRFRLSSAGSLLPSGLAYDGEVEDYVFQIQDDATDANVVVDLPPGGGELVVDGSDVVVRQGTTELFRAPGAIVNSIRINGTQDSESIGLGELAAVFAGLVSVHATEGLDTLQLEDGGQTLNLPAMSGTQITGFERIDITGSGGNTLILDSQSVIDLSDESDTLMVLADSDDEVRLGDGWTFEGTEVDQGAAFLRYRQGTAVVKVLNRPPADIDLNGSVVDENAPATTFVGRISAIDPDTNDTAVFVLQDDADGRFAILGRHLVVADGSLLDFETATVHEVTVRVTDSGGAVFDETFTITVADVNEPSAGITVDPESGLMTIEAGSQTTFSLVLDSQPSAEVTIDLTSSDTTEGTVSPSSVTFTTSNWSTRRMVMITGVDDHMDDGDVNYTIETDPATSSDAKYSGLNAVDMSLANRDDDRAGITVIPTSGLITTERGGKATFAIVLDSEPTANVTIGLSSTNANEGTVSPSEVTFTPTDWDVAQTVTIAGQNDDVNDDDVTYTIETAPASSADVKYDGLNAVDMTCTNLDDDGIGFTVTESGTADAFSVALNAEPEGEVAITVTSGDTGEVVADKASLTFTPANWDEPQTVTVVGVDDYVLDGDQTTTITLSIDDANSDDAFDLLVDQTFLVTITDDGCHSWQNCRNRFDVDGRDGVTPVDVLTLIVYLNGGNTSLPAPPATPPPFYDVNDDGACTPLDVLMVIVFINNRQLAESGEGEAAQFPAPTFAIKMPSSPYLADRLTSPRPAPNGQTSVHNERSASLWATAGDDEILTDAYSTQRAFADADWDDGARDELDAAFAELGAVLPDLAPGLSDVAS